jgi:CheY-like chemotaxis protein
MDHMMPGMDGVEAVARIRSLESDYYTNLPIIALTANAVSGMKEMFLEQGFNDFLSKPIEIAKLDELIEKWTPAEKKLTLEQGSREQKTPDKSEALPEIPGVDTAKGLSMTGGTIGAYKKVLSMFRKDAEERLPLLAKTPEEAELAAFTTQAHAIKSAAGTIGAAEVSAEAAELEAAGKAGDMAAIAERLPRFYKGLSEVIEAIGGAMKNEQGIIKSEENAHYSGFTAHGSWLKAALETKNMKEIDRLLEEIEKMPLDEKAREAVNAVSDKVLIGEYGEALQVLAALPGGEG